MHKVIETLEGKGRLTSAEAGQDYAVKYELHIVQEEIPAPTRLNIHATEAGASSIVATLHFGHLGNGPVFSEQQPLVLHLDDGRKIPLSCKGYGLYQATGAFF